MATIEEIISFASEQEGSLRKVAEAIGVSVTTLSLIKNGKYERSTEPTYKKLIAKYGESLLEAG